MSDKAIQSSFATIVTEVKEMRAAGAATSLHMDGVVERLQALSKKHDEHTLQNDAKMAPQRELINTLTGDLDSLGLPTTEVL
jgi:hypothetical protein